MYESEKREKVSIRSLNNFDVLLHISNSNAEYIWFQNIFYNSFTSRRSRQICLLQARPSDYATAYLASQEPVSFHKFWMVEPKMVYDEWFAEADRSLKTVNEHIEL